MKITLTKCDGCGSTENVSEYKLDCGTEMDPSGNGYNTIWDHKDWCFDCFKKFILSSKDPVKLLRSVNKR